MRATQPRREWIPLCDKAARHGGQFFAFKLEHEPDRAAMTDEERQRFDLAMTQPMHRVA
jgi:hypothetical protein